MHIDVNHLDIPGFQQNLIQWYNENKRDLPWRENQDPYRVWVSEVMLQQTKVETVIPYYKRFMELFPTLHALAAADEDKVLKAWEGLGYYSRARNLHTAVKEVAAGYGGKVPSSKKEFAALKGVGPYTAGAVLSIAFEKREPAVDGNVMRVFSRILLVTDDISKPKTRKSFEQTLTLFLEGVQPSEFNQAVMELGALICTPRSPGCLLCPVQMHCRAREEGVQENLPVKAKKKAPAVKKMAAVILKNNNGQTLFHQRGETGLLARLWEYPNLEVPAGQTSEEVLEAFLEHDYGLRASIIKPLQHVEHIFSHLVWNITVYEARLLEEEQLHSKGEWLYLHEAERHTFPVSHQKILHRQIQREG